MKYRDAISQSIVQAMKADPKVLLLGEMVTDPKHVFNTTALAHEHFPSRVIETPVSESMITGACVGLALEGWRPILVHARADFSPLSFSHLINTAAKIPFLHRRPLPFVMRVIVGRGWGQGPVHSQSFHHMLAQVPGLNVFVPSPGRYDFLLGTALRSRQPSVIVEPRRLYETEQSEAAGCVVSPSDIVIACIGDTILDGHIAHNTLRKMRIRASVLPWEDLQAPHPEQPWSDGVPVLMADMAPRRPEHGVVAPPFTPQGVSQSASREL